MLSDELRGLVVQARRNIRDPAFLDHVFARLNEVAAELETIESSALIALPSPPRNVVSLDARRRRDG